MAYAIISCIKKSIRSRMRSSLLNLIYATAQKHEIRSMPYSILIRSNKTRVPAHNPYKGHFSFLFAAKILISCESVNSLRARRRRRRLGGIPRWKSYKASRRAVHVSGETLSEIEIPPPLRGRYAQNPGPLRASGEKSWAQRAFNPQRSSRQHPDQRRVYRMLDKSAECGLSGSRAGICRYKAEDVCIPYLEWIRRIGLDKKWSSKGLESSDEPKHNININKWLFHFKR